MNVSVAMCTYNGERYLRQQLDSIAAQTHLPLELIVCDDRSTDDTPRIVLDFATAAPFPVHFHVNPVNLGSTANFSQAIGLCTGELIALCDQDDLWREDKLETQIRIFEGDASIGGVFSDGDLINGDGTSLNRSLWDSMTFTPLMQQQVRDGSPLLALARRNFVTGAALTFRSSLRTSFFPIPQEWVHDGWIAWKICAYSKLHMIKEHLISYRVHASNQIGVNLQSPSDLLRTRTRDVLTSLYRADLKRLILLRDNIRAATLHPEKLSSALLDEKIAFLEARIAVTQQHRLLRLPALLREVGHYRRFAKGWRSMVGDLLVS